MTFYNEKVQPTKDELLQALNKKFLGVKKMPISDAQSFAGLIRSTLDGAVQYFYKSKYDDIPVWVIGDSPKASFNLNKAIEDKKFRQYFDSFIISDMQNIRITCNNILHNPTVSLPVDTARDMLERLEKCIHRIESVLQETILLDNTSDIVNEPCETDLTDEENTDQTAQLKEPLSPEEQFWALFHEKLLENGEPFKLYPHGEYAVIGEEQVGKCSIVAELNLQQKVLNLGVGDKSGSNSAYRDCFKRYQGELEIKLEKPITVAIPRANYGYYAVMQFPFASDVNGYEAVIEEAIWRINEYQTVIPEYLAKPMPAQPIPAPRPSSKHGQAYTTGDTFSGIDFTDMFNHALGTHYMRYMRCRIGLKSLGFSDDGMAWFVFMNGTVHGPHKGFLFVNRISPDGNTIEEEYVGNNKASVKMYLPPNDVRLCFQRDPLGTGDEYLCKFVGVFQISGYKETEKGFIRIHKKVSDTYPF